MVTHGFRHQPNAPVKNHNCNARSRSILRPVKGGRPRGWDEEKDYEVIFRGRNIGIWRYDYTDKVGGEMARHLC
jgi:hypothetical protein